MPMTILTMHEVNNIISEHFIKIFGNVVEHCPAAAIAIIKNKPFQNASDLSRAIDNYLDGLNVNEQQVILQAYSDSVAKLADLSKIILGLDQSQKFVGVDQLTIDDQAKLNRLNKQYKEKFNFPFVIYGKENNIFTIFSEMEMRIQNDKEKEIAVAIAEVKKIGKLRIFEIMQG